MCAYNLNSLLLSIVNDNNKNDTGLQHEVNFIDIVSFVIAIASYLMYNVIHYKRVAHLIMTK